MSQSHEEYQYTSSSVVAYFAIYSKGVDKWGWGGERERGRLKPPRFMTTGTKNIYHNTGVYKVKLLDELRE